MKAPISLCQSRAALSALKSLTQEADRLGLKYLAVECSVYRGPSSGGHESLPEARQELDQALLKGEKLGLRALLARSHCLTATTLRLARNNGDAALHYQKALALPQEIQTEPGADKVISRADLSSIYTESARWSEGAET
jgi:hypothetical protein